MTTRSTRKTITQCKTCPWRVGCEPIRDIPNYREDLARKLDKTIAKDPIDSLRSAMGGSQHVMACHYSKPQKEIPCTGWLHNQLGVGNNIAVRLGIMSGHFPIPKVTGDQHDRYEDTLPSDPRPAPRRRS